MDRNIIAVVVTYNRKDLLLECLESISSQTMPVNKIVLIDNASTDGTQSAVKEAGYMNDRLDYNRMSENTGGAGGFYFGIEKAMKMGGDWIWIMDDDTIPKQDCLERLFASKERICSRIKTEEISFLASSIYGSNGEVMNVPIVSSQVEDTGYLRWYQMLDYGCVEIMYATFVSLLFNGKAINKCGLPCKDYFIWGDDYEYTRRLTKFFGRAYMVGDSIAIHKRVNAKALDIRSEDNLNRVKLFRYFYRNNLINRRFYEGYYHPLKQLIKAIKEAASVLNNKHGFSKAKAILKGNLEALTQYKKFEKYILNEVKK